MRRSLGRPAKVRRLFAMRACRSSVMIGTPLTRLMMQRLVRRMADVDKPWNCPHGRPTMRHLLSLGGWKAWKEGDGLAGEHKVDVDWGEYVGRTRGGPGAGAWGGGRPQQRTASFPAPRMFL